MSSSISLLQWRKAYMLEFLNDTEVVEVFTFSVPPEGEEFDFPQRVNETKTFGGSVFDDYGNDTYRITLNGTTINEEKKFIYRGLKKAPLYLSGTKEIFELQKIIKNWADGKVSTGFFRKGVDDIGTSSKRKVYLYDLSKMSVLQIATGVASRNYWRVFIKDLKIKRDKSKPKTYNYTLEMIAVEDEEGKKNGFFGSDIADSINALQDAMDKVNTVMEITEATTAAFNETAVLLNTLTKNLDRAHERQIVTATLDTFTRVLGADSSSLYNCTANVLLGVQNFRGICENSESGVTKKSSSENTGVFTAQFDTDGGSYVKTQKIEYCKTVEKPENPTKEYHDFSGWYSDEAFTTEYDFTQEVTENLTIFAKWVLATAKVTFNSRNGSSVTPQYVAVGNKAEVPTPPTRSGYAFDKWYTDYACTTEFDFDTPITADITLYAGWKQTCNIIFNSNGGSEVETQVVNIGALAVYPMTPTRENYTFAYWCSDSELQNVFDFSTPINADITLYACWVQISNTVTFNSQGGSAVDSQKIAIGGYAAKPSTPTKTGYDFVYWATDEAGTNEFRFATTPINASITLYAKWTETICAVSFDTDGGSEVEAQGVGYGNKAIFPPIPAKEGCTFEKWQIRKEIETDSGETDENGNPIMTTEYEYEEFDFNTAITEDITLYALWFGGEQ